MKNKNNFWTLLVKEIYYNYFLSPLGLIFAGLFSLISNWLFFQDFFLSNQASLGPLFNLFPFLFLFFLPAITMNLFAEEKKSRTWEILLTLPTNEKKVAGAKFLAALLFTAFTMVPSLTLPITLAFLGQPDWGVIISSYLGAILLAGSYISIGAFFSSLTNNPIISFLVSVLFLLVNFFTGQEAILSRLPTFAANIISYLSTTFHFHFFTEGNIPLSSLIFFLSWISLFIWLTVVSLKSRDY